VTAYAAATRERNGRPPTGKRPSWWVVRWRTGRWRTVAPAGVRPPARCPGSFRTAWYAAPGRCEAADHARARRW